MAQQAQDTFVAMMDDGSQRFVSKGEVLPDSHELVRRDADNSGRLFRKLDLGEDEKPPPKSSPAKADSPKAAPVTATANVKATGKAS